MNNLLENLFNNTIKIKKIIGYLDVNDRFRFRQLNKRFKKIIDKIKIKDLTISNTGLINSCFISNDLIDQHEIICNISLSYTYKGNLKLHFKFPFSICQSVRRLKFNYDELDCNFFNLKKLEKFENLEQLEFKNLTANKFRLAVYLKKLKRLRIEKVSSDSVSIIFILPNLKYWFTGYNVPQCIKLKHPQTIRYFDFYDFISIDAKLNTYKNLEIVKCNNVLKLRNDIISSFIELPNLKEFHFNLDFTDELLIGQLDKLKAIFNYLLKQIKVKRLLNLKLFIRGIRIAGDKQFDEYNFKNDLLTLHFENYNCLAKQFPLFNSINYNDLLDLIQDEIPIDFHCKYPNLQKVTVFEQIEQAKFLKFLKSCRKLLSLILIDTHLNQDFYNELASFKSTLIELELIEREKEIDFHFLVKLDYLDKFKTNI